jgi:hypothetical protein
MIVPPNRIGKADYVPPEVFAKIQKQREERLREEGI